MNKANEFYQRKNTRTVYIGQVAVGGCNDISIQSMCNTKTADITATLAQLKQLAAAGAQIGRVAVPDSATADVLDQLVAASPLPLVADIHFDYRLALAAVKASVAGLRINPGNIGSKERVKEVALAARAAGIPIRIGVNGGSLEKELLEKHGAITSEALVESALRQAEMLEDLGFHDIKISLKASDVPTMIAAYRRAAGLCDYPLHIGVTETGTFYRGSLKSALGIGTLLMEGIGDTMRVSLTCDPVQEVQVAKDILSVLGLRRSGWEFVSCPTCGRTEVDLIDLAHRVERVLAEITPPKHLKVAVMGCAVNGPGEASDADIGIACTKHGGIIFRHGERLGYHSEDELFDEFIHEIRKMIGQ